ncbi:MAG: Nif3-like dinuclear metal center hexameric protein [Proteobacteria bacterium]|nr:Nif3-like dinuclear metal center hexameric protein [Pseudomonadota bacterium]MBU1685768.1 Nif3-like dinuclear metal center hexameric protein [Pseudomonadota bacterium]
MGVSQLTVNHLLSILEKIAEPGLAESWDNIGLMVGAPDQTIDGILIALDTTPEVLAEAVATGCNIIVTHHPLIFKPMRSIRTDLESGRLISAAIKQDLAIIACHTNLDKAIGGVNDALAAAFNLRDSAPLLREIGQPEVPGFGRIGDLPSPLPFQEFINLLLDTLGLDGVRFAGPSPKIVSRVALCGGSGSELAVNAREAAAQVYITGEVKHSDARWAEAAHFCIIDAGHYATENVVVPTLTDAIAKACLNHGPMIPVLATTTQKNPFRHCFRSEDMKN